MLQLDRCLCSAHSRCFCNMCLVDAGSAVALVFAPMGPVLCALTCFGWLSAVGLSEVLCLMHCLSVASVTASARVTAANKAGSLTRHLVGVPLFLHGLPPHFMLRRAASLLDAIGIAYLSNWRCLRGLGCRQTCCSVAPFSICAVLHVLCLLWL